MVDKEEELKKRQEAYKLIFQKDNIYMEEHRKSLEPELIIEECVFRCGRLTDGISDLCAICEEVYGIYIMQQTNGGENSMEDEKKEEDKPEEGSEEKKEETTEEKPTDDDAPD